MVERFEVIQDIHSKFLDAKKRQVLEDLPI